MSTLSDHSPELTIGTASRSHKRAVTRCYRSVAWEWAAFCSLPVSCPERRDRCLCDYGLTSGTGFHPPTERFHFLILGHFPQPTPARCSPGTIVLSRESPRPHSLSTYSSCEHGYGNNNAGRDDDKQVTRTTACSAPDSAGVTSEAPRITRSPTSLRQTIIQPTDHMPSFVCRHPGSRTSGTGPASCVRRYLQSPVLAAA